MLNYGYTVLRAATARAVVGAGLHPTVGLHHANAGNAMRLVDDLMEPFRPTIDARVWDLQALGITALTPATKQALAQVLYVDVPTGGANTPIWVCLQRLGVSLVQYFLTERNDLDLPSAAVPGTLPGPVF